MDTFQNLTPEIELLDCRIHRIDPRRHLRHLRENRHYIRVDHCHRGFAGRRLLECVAWFNERVRPENRNSRAGKNPSGRRGGCAVEGCLLMEVRPFEDADEEAVVDLWNRCGLLRPSNDPHKDIARKKKFQRELFLVAVESGAIVGTAMAGYDGHRGWVNYLAVDPARRRKGYGRALMDEAQRRLLALGCPKINLQVRLENGEAMAFYQRIGFREDFVASFGKRLEQDE